MNHDTITYFFFFQRFLNDIHQELRLRMPLVLDAQVEYGKYMTSKDVPRYTLPSYYETRFCSCGSFSNAFKELFDFINQYGWEVHKKVILPEQYCPYITIPDSFLLLSNLPLKGSNRINWINILCAYKNNYAKNFFRTMP